MAQKEKEESQQEGGDKSNWKHRLVNSLKSIGSNIDNVKATVQRSSQVTCSITDPAAYLMFQTAQKIMGGNNKDVIIEFIKTAKAKDSEMFGKLMSDFAKMTPMELEALFPVRDSGKGKKTQNYEALL